MFYKRHYFRQSGITMPLLADLIMKTVTRKTVADTYHALIRHLVGMMDARPEKVFHFAFSGGESLWPLFDIWANDYRSVTPWNRMRIYWADERYVPAEHSDSHYGALKRLLLSKADIPSACVYPVIYGQRWGAGREAERYAVMTAAVVPSVQGRPVFDAVLLGIEADGRVASIYPGQEHLLASPKAYVSCTNPYTGQPCVTMTGTTLLAASQLVLLAAGEGCRKVVDDILHSGDTSPMAYIAHHAADVVLFMEG